MTINLFQVLLIILSCNEPVSQGEMEWCEGVRLKWSDFSYSASLRGAKTYATIHTTFNIEDKVYKIDVVALFDRQKSLVYDSVAYLLEHEQIHFDIVELTVRRMRKFIKSQVVTDDNFDKIMVQLEGMENFRHEKDSAFDLETNNGRNPDSQSKWKELIRRELMALDMFKLVCKK